MNQSSGQLGGNTGKNPEAELEVPKVFKIEKTEGSSIFGNSVPPEVAVAPTPIQTASGEDSLIVLSNTTQTPRESGINIITEAVSTPTADMVMTTPVQEVTSTPNPLMDVIQNSPAVNTPATSDMPLFTEPSSMSTDSLFGNLSDTSMPVQEPIKTEVTQSVPEESVFLTPLIEIAEPVESPIETPVIQAETPENIADEVDVSDKTPEVKAFFHPTDFIQKSIAEIDTMIDAIEKEHTEKMNEAESYKLKKEEFTKLEEKAYIEAGKMDEETAHALHMKKLLLSELPENKKKPEKNSHVETTLTGMAVVNTVEQTIEAPKHHTKAKLAA